MAGTLYVVSTPIGNPDDLTLRGLRILTEVEAIICEEARAGSALLSHFGLDKPLVELNEHTEEEEVPALTARLAGGAALALISDHGTPLVSDPGATLVRQAVAARIPVTPVPGASSILAGLVASGLPAARFRFVGQLPPKTEPRRRALARLSDLPDTLVILEAPYRLLPLLRALRAEFGPDRRVAVACNLTMPEERIVRSTVADALHEFEQHPFKGEFVLIVEGKPRVHAHHKELT